MTLEEYLQQLLPAQQPVYQPTAVQGLLTPRQDEVTAYDPSFRRQGANATQGLLENIGINRGQARQVSQTLLGGESSMMPANMGVADFTPFVGYGLGAGESIEGVGQAKKDFESGNYGSAALNYALSSLGLLPAVGAATAFHGTPHKIVDKFDINKVGTGEGAQAYGHGMYFAENPKVAQEYADELGSKIDVNGNPLYVANKTIGTTGNAELDDYLIANLGNVKDTKKQMLADIKDVRSTNPDAAKEMQQTLAQLRKSNVAVQNKGNFYKVDIPDADISKMLDWDKPFNQQTPEVRSAFNKLYSDVNIADSDNADWFKNIDKDRASMSAMYNNLATSDNLKGAKDVSRLLSEQGVTGVRYLDEGSRGAGKGTSNFVTFNPEEVKILEENGINYDELMKSGLLGRDVPSNATNKAIRNADDQPYVSYFKHQDEILTEMGDIEYGDPYVLIDKVYVPDDMRKQGIGRKILRENLHEMQKEYPGLPIKLAAYPDANTISMDDLVKFYEKENFYIDEVFGDSVIMEFGGIINK